MKSYIIAFDYKRYGYMTTYYSVSGMTYDKSKAAIFNDLKSAQYVYNKLLGGRLKYFKYVQDRSISIVEV
jgi:hypothetical protein